MGVMTGERMDTSHEDRERVSHAHLPRVVIVGGGFEAEMTHAEPGRQTTRSLEVA